MDQRCYYKMGNEKRKKIVRGVGNPNWKRDATEVKLINKIHNQWCKDNGYPLIKGKWIKVLGENLIKLK